MKYLSLDELSFVPTSHSGVGKKKVLISEGAVKNLQQLGIVTFQPGEVVAPHSHTDFSEIMYIEEGTADMRVKSKEFSIKKGTCIIVYPNEEHTIRVTGNSPLTLIFFGIYI